MLFSEVSFRIAPGRHAGFVGTNGVGKSTLFAVIAGLLAPLEGEVNVGGRLAFMPQDVGIGDDERTVRELLLSLAARRLRSAGEEALAAERELSQGADAAEAGVRMGNAIAEWSQLGGYELEGQWDASCRRIVGAALDDVGARSCAQLSGGERKRLVLDVLFSSDAQVLLLDEPDNFLDVAAKRDLERRIRDARQTILVISHDRHLLSEAVEQIVTIEGLGSWTHGGSYRDYRDARDRRQERLGDRLQRWKDEERRLYRYTKTLKERARYSSVFAKKADAAETRWKRFVDAGPPPAPVPDHHIQPRLRGGDSARKAVALRELSIAGLVAPFDEEIHYGERVGLIGPNGSGKTHLMRLVAGEEIPHSGIVTIGNRVSPGLFTQLNRRADLQGAPVLDIVQRRTGGLETAMRALARYGLSETARRTSDGLSGGQRARLEILCLELDGHNLLLLDEPTDNLDIDSAEALEQALDQFEGSVLAVSHDRAFLRTLDRFLLVDHDGAVYALPDVEVAMEALVRPYHVAQVRLAKRLTPPKRAAGERTAVAIADSRRRAGPS